MFFYEQTFLKIVGPVKMDALFPGIFFYFRCDIMDNDYLTDIILKRYSLIVLLF